MATETADGFQFIGDDLTLNFYQMGKDPRKVTVSKSKNLLDLVGEMLGYPAKKDMFYDFLVYTDNPGQSGRPERVIPEDLQGKIIADLPFFAYKSLHMVLRVAPNRQTLSIC
eukprot:TRINITY_DN8691_c0_g1_i1.p2 TRINITY_DN8691_c0_g1~~TRINITY_DN8691_c0_g1_i1.p2  ORF type:complete len:112 (+),score=46.12 TRINITY_DN8691_c0_g1_i1:28-363(+)